MRYFLGVDSGGSKAAYALVDQDGAAYGQHIDAGYNRTVDPTPATVAQITQGITDCLAQAPADRAQITGICFGLSYFGELAAKDAEITAALRRAFSGTDCYFTNDSEVGWAGSLAGKPGINIVAGTGAMAYGQNGAGVSARTGGWNHFFSDEGSCYWLGRKTMELFSKQADGRARRGPLYDIVRQTFGLADNYEFIVIMEQEYISSRRKVAELQILLEQAATEGDVAAADLYRQATDELALIVSTLAEQLGFLGGTFPVSYSGGLFRSADGQDDTIAAKKRYVTTPLCQKVEDLGGVLQEPLLAPWQGAALCAIRQFYPEALGSATANMLKNT